MTRAERERRGAAEVAMAGPLPPNVVRLPRRVPPVFATWDEFLAYHVPKRSARRRAVVVPLRPPPPPGSCRRVSKP